MLTRILACLVGAFTFSQLPIGVYQVTIALPGFRGRSFFHQTHVINANAIVQLPSATASDGSIATGCSTPSWATGGSAPSWRGRADRR
jgi:hypothetical protein